jgi:hypothetical protein
VRYAYPSLNNSQSIIESNYYYGNLTSLLTEGIERGNFTQILHQYSAIYGSRSLYYSYSEDIPNYFPPFETTSTPISQSERNSWTEVLNNYRNIFTVTGGIIFFILSLVALYYFVWCRNRKKATKSGNLTIHDNRQNSHRYERSPNTILALEGNSISDNSSSYNVVGRSISRPMSNNCHKPDYDLESSRNDNYQNSNISNQSQLQSQLQFPQLNNKEELYSGNHAHYTKALPPPRPPSGNYLPRSYNDATDIRTNQERDSPRYLHSILQIPLSTGRRSNTNSFKTNNEEVSEISNIDPPSSRNFHLSILTSNYSDNSLTDLIITPPSPPEVRPTSSNLPNVRPLSRFSPANLTSSEFSPNSLSPLSDNSPRSTPPQSAPSLSRALYRQSSSRSSSFKLSNGKYAVYIKMQQLNIPDEVIRHKMMMDSISDAEIEQFFIAMQNKGANFTIPDSDSDMLLQG